MARIDRIGPPATLGRGMPRLRLTPVLLLLTSVAACIQATARTSEWSSTQGTAFRADPVEVLGAIATFQSSLTTGQRLKLRGLSDEDCRRFFRETQSRPARAATWARAKGAATADLVGRVLTVNRRELVPADLAALPEPELLVLLFGSHGNPETWEMIQNFNALYRRVQRVFPGRLGAVFLGYDHTAAEHKRLATETAMPWLVADLAAEPAMDARRYLPDTGTRIVVLSRDGAPLIVTRPYDLASMRRFSDDLTDLLAELDPANPRTWKDRLHYGRVVRPLAFAETRAEPLLVGNPLRADGLRQRGIGRVSARLDVGADGAVSAVTWQADAIVPEPMRQPLAEALRRHALFLPAIDRGREVAGSFAYVFDVPPADARAAADAAWLDDNVRITLPLPHWLVLKPVPVREEDFGDAVEHVDGSGVVTLKAMEITDAKVTRQAQMNAFNSDWFGPVGSGGVHPVAGQAQMVDGLALTWQAVDSADGYVDLQDGRRALDYCIGYAWTEFDAPADMDAWLGLGSDDGVKIWHNGELVCDQWIRRLSRLDDDVVPLHLKQGKNRLLIKIQNATGAWSFIARLRVRAD